MHKDYKHPAPYRPDYDYLTGIRKTNEHIKRITMEEPHPGQAQHLGGMASYNDHLQEMHYGQGHAVKKELKRVIDYLYYYAETGHDIYKFLAEDAFMHVEQLQADIMDEAEKEHVKYFLDCTREYMDWLKPENTGLKFPARQPSGSDSNDSGIVNL